MFLVDIVCCDEAVPLQTLFLRCAHEPVNFVNNLCKENGAWHYILGCAKVYTDIWQMDSQVAKWLQQMSTNPKVQTLPNQKTIRKLSSERDTTYVDYIQTEN